MISKKIKHFLNADWAYLVYSGSGAQALNLLAYPVLANLYSPSDFGLFAFSLSLIVLFGSLIFCRTDALIQIVDESRERSVLIFSLVSGFFLAIALYCIFWLFKTIGLLDDLDVDLTPFLAALIIIGSLLHASFALSRQVFAKRRTYKRFASANLIRTLVTLSSQILLVGIVGNTYGLISGFFAGLISAIIIVNPYNFGLLKLLVFDRTLVKHSILSVIKKNGQYLRVDMSSVLLAALTNALPLAIILFSFGAQTAGIYALASRFVFIPIDVIAGSISTYVFERMSTAYRAKLQIISFYRKFVVSAFIFSAFFSTVILVLMPIFVSTLFNDRWQGISEYSVLILPIFIAQFCVSCVGAAPLVLEKPGVTLIWNAFRFLSIMLAWYMSIGQSAPLFLVSYGALILFGCFVYLSWIYVLIVQNRVIKYG